MLADFIPTTKKIPGTGLPGSKPEARLDEDLLVSKFFSDGNTALVVCRASSTEVDAAGVANEEFSSYTFLLERGPSSFLQVPCHLYASATESPLEQQRLI